MTTDMYDDGSTQRWSGNPNAALLREAAHLSPGTALDIGAGEGADARWLHQQGFNVTAVEPSPIACARIGDEITVINDSFEAADLGRFDLVTAFYTPLLDDAATREKLLGCLAPQGTLIMVHHVDVSHMAAHHCRSESEFLLPGRLHEWVAANPEFQVETFGTFPRSVSHGAGAGHSEDVVLKITNIGSPAGPRS